MSYLCDQLFIFSLIFIFVNNITSFKQTHLFLFIFLEYLPLFWMITWMKKVNNFPILKAQPQGVATKLLLNILQILTWSCL